MKLIADTTCPGCKKNHEVEIDIDKLDVKTPPSSTTNAQASDQTTQQVEKLIEPEIKIETKTVIEDFKPNYECPDGNCTEGGVHRNKNHTKKVKGKCNNCDQFTKYDKGTCPWCEKNDTIEEIDSEELEELGIKNPLEVEHEEHTHE